MTEQMIGGGHLVRVHGGSGLAVEGVPNAKRGMVVASASAYLDGGSYLRGTYRLTSPVVAGTDLWGVRRVAPVDANTQE